jgi:hypothetical protein
VIEVCRRSANSRRAVAFSSADLVLVRAARRVVMVIDPSLPVYFRRHSAWGVRAVHGNGVLHPERKSSQPEAF